jgi:hypothetical protein
LPFEFLYALLEDFFEDNGIEIVIERIYDPKINYWAYRINNYDLLNNCNSKNKAKYQAALKACEILENLICK